MAPLVPPGFAAPVVTCAVESCQDALLKGSKKPSVVEVEVLMILAILFSRVIFKYNATITDISNKIIKVICNVMEYAR